MLLSHCLWRLSCEKQGERLAVTGVTGSPSAGLIFIHQRRSERRPCDLANKPSCDVVRLGRATVASLRTSPHARPACWVCMHLFDWPELAPLSPPAPADPPLLTLRRRCAFAGARAAPLRLVHRAPRSGGLWSGRGGVTSPAVSLHLKGHAPTRGCDATTPALPPCVNRLRRET